MNSLVQGPHSININNLAEIISLSSPIQMPSHLYSEQLGPLQVSTYTLQFPSLSLESWGCGLR